jgi:RNA polymerase sigma-70 factor (ECF subfamily)
MVPGTDTPDDRDHLRWVRSENQPNKIMTATIDIDLSADDQQLMEGLTRRQPFALEQLYKRYKVVLKSIVLQVLHDDADAEDVLQDVFIQVWERAGTYSAEKGKLLSWLATMARRRAIDRVRQYSAYHRATERFEEELSAPGKGHEENHTVEREAQNGDLKDLVAKHLDLLPPTQREVIHMVFFEGKSQREISSLTGTPLGTVKTRIELGIKKLGHSIGGLREQMI